MKLDKKSDLNSTPSPNHEIDLAAKADLLAKPMFGLSLLFLVLLAGLVVAWVDILPDPPPEQLLADGDAEAGQVAGRHWQEPALQIGYILLWSLLAIWPLFLIEPIYVRILSKRSSEDLLGFSKSDWWSAACPPLRLGKSIAAKGGRIWLPKRGWRMPGKTLHKELERDFSKPMLVIAMMILPILVVEFCFQDLLQSTAWLKLLLSVSMGFIWCAFTCEFILMVSATNKKLAYVKKNWIDLAIILLPLVSFLRSLRIVRAAKVARFAKIQQLTKMSRVYRMRGLIAKTVRAFLVLELVHRILRISPEKRLEKLLAQVEEKQEELRELQDQVKAVRVEVEKQRTEILPKPLDATTENKVETRPRNAAPHRPNVA